MSETENTSPEQQETQAPDKRRSCKIFLAKAAFTLGTLAVFYGGYLDWQIRSKWMAKFGVYRQKCIVV